MTSSHEVPLTADSGVHGSGRPGDEPRAITGLLSRLRDGDREALEELLPLVYGELRRLAERYLRGERPGHTLQPTALVHEAYLRLVDERGRRWQDGVHFYAAASQLMRRILVDHARGRAARKRGGGAAFVSLDEARERVELRAEEMVALDDALQGLEAVDPRKARIIELRFFGGLTIEETASLVGLSAPTVVTETRMARAWLFKEMGGLAR